MGTRIFKDLFIGLIIGVISNVPGASGATVAAIFGIYERLITDVANIKNKLLHDLKFVITILAGFIVGIILCAICLEFFIENFKVPMMLFFAVIIAMQIPDVKKMVSCEGPTTRSDIIAFAVGFVVMIVLFCVEPSDTNVNKDPGFLLLFLIGIICAISKLAPGISGSTVLLALGLFYVFNDAIANIKIFRLLPILLGLIIGVLTFAKIIEYFLKRSKKSVYATVLGLTVGSAVTVAVKALKEALESMTVDVIIQSIIGVIIGIIFGALLTKMAHYYQRSQNDTC